MVFHTGRIFNMGLVFDKLVHVERETKNKSQRKKDVLLDETVKVSSLRLTTFKEKGVKCHTCEREGTHFRLQRNDKGTVFHLGLWSDDDVEMTKDHIVPRSMGGLDVLGNMQTMCEECNGNKRNNVNPEDYERGVFDENVAISKKYLIA